MTLEPQVHQLLTEATQQLLGDTIVVTDETWRQPSRLPGWSRGHVATHLARNADALGRLLEGVRTGQPAQMYPNAETRDAEIDQGADRTGLELQQDLDATAGLLDEAFERLITDGQIATPVSLRLGVELTAGDLIGARLNEVFLHHHDLDIGFNLADGPFELAAAGLAAAVRRTRQLSAMPPVRLQWESGSVVTADGDPAATVSGEPPALLGWLTGRDAGPVTGGNGIVLPPY